MLVGNLVIFNIDESTRDLTALSENDVNNIGNNLMLAIDYDRERVYPVVVANY